MIRGRELPKEESGRLEHQWTRVLCEEDTRPYRSHYALHGWAVQ
jgi:hypothetical protein